MIPDELMWATGLFEGEGCITMRRRRKRRYVALSIEMTDEDVLHRFRRVVGVGNVVSPRQRGIRRKPTWTWVVVGHDAETLVRRLLPELGARRRQRALDVLGECVPGEHTDQLRMVLE